MPDIDKIKLPSGNVYNIKDTVARQAIAGGMSRIISWNGSSIPDVSTIPSGVVVTYNGTQYTGTMSASTAETNGFYMVYSGTQEDSNDRYDEYVVVDSGSTKTWEKIGDTSLNLDDLGELAYKDNVTASPSAVTFSGGTTDKVLGSDATFTTTVTPTTTRIKATASNVVVAGSGTAAAVTGYASPATETFVKSVAAETSNKLVTTSVPNVTNVGSASSWSFTMGTGSDAETLIISGTNSTVPTLGTAITAATGSVSASGTGSPVVTGVTIGESASAITGLGTPTTAPVLTGVEVTTQPTVSLSTGAAAGDGVVSVATGITSASTVASNKDEVTAVTSVGTGTAAAQVITVS